MNFARTFLTGLAVLLLAACMSSGYGTLPWKSRAYVPAAQAAPRTLTTTPPAGSAVQTPPPVTPAGFEISEQSPPPTSGYSVMDEPVQPAAVPLPAAPSSGTVKVALIVPLSGDQAALGQAMLQAAQMALFDVGQESLELLPRDSGSTPQDAARAAESAIAEGAQLVLGPVFAASVRAVQPVIQRHNINMIAFSTDWKLAGGNTFIMGFLPFEQVSRIVGFAAQKGIRRIGVLAPDSDYGNAVLAAYGEAARHYGLAGTDIVRFSPGQKDLTDVVARFARHAERERLTAAGGGAAGSLAPVPFDAVLMPVGGEQAKAIAGLLTYYGLPPESVRRLGTGLFDDTSLALDPALKNAWFAAPAPDQRRNFERRYADLYGDLRPPRLATLAYDATALAAILARQGSGWAGQSPFSRESLLNPNGFAGLDGVFRFRPDGLAERGLAVLEFKDLTPQTVDPAPRTFQGWMGQ